MATIASFVADLGIDPAGVKAGLDKAAGYVRQFAKTADQDITGSLQKSNNVVSSLTARVLQLAAALGVAFAIKAGIDFNRTMESAELGIASLITAQAQLRDRNGQLLTGTAALGAAQLIAAGQMRELRVAGLQTVATTEELVAGFQQAVGVGLRWGLTLDQIRKVTIGIVQAAGALGVPMNQLNEEIRDLLAGNINARNTRVATALGITNEDIRNAREAGNLAGFVLDRLKAFNVAGAATAQTWTGVLSNIREAFSLFMGDSLKPAFESVKLALNTALTEAFDFDNATISQKFSAIIEVAQRVFGGIGDVLAKGIGLAVSAAKDFNEWLVENHNTVDEILTAFKFIADEVGSLVGDIVKFLISLVAASAETGILKGVLYTISLIVALIHTGFEGLVWVFAKLGQIILNLLLKPLIWLSSLIGKIVGLVDKDAAAAFEGIAAWGDEFLSGISKGLDDYEQQLAIGGTALDRWTEKVQSADEAAKKLTKTKKTAFDGTLSPNAGGGLSIEDQIKQLEQLTSRLVTLRNIQEKSGTLTSQFSSKAADALIQAEKLLARETDKLSDNAVRLTIVLDKLKEAYLKTAGALPNVGFTPVANPRSVDARGNPTNFAARTSLLRGGAASTVGLVGLNSGPGFTLPQPKAAPLPPSLQSEWQIRFNAAMSQVSAGAEKVARGFGNLVASGGMEVLRSVLSQLNPFAIIVSALTDAMKPLEPVLKVLAHIIAEVLGPIFEDLAPIVEAFIPFFRALLQIIAPLVRGLLPILLAFVPILEALFPVIKFVAIAFTYVVQAAATVASWLLRFGGNVIIVIGKIFKALAEAIDHLPFVSAQGAIDFAQGLIDFGGSLLSAADAAMATADGMKKAREDINKVQIDHTVDGINDLGDAADKTAQQLLNVPQWFKINLARFRAASPVDPTYPGDGRGGEPRRRYPDLRNGGATDTGGTGTGDSGGRGLTIDGDVYIDAKSLSAAQMFDQILDEGKKRARAQGVPTWSDVL